MGRQRKRRNRKGKMTGMAFLFFLLILAIAALIVVKAFVVKKVVVTGSTHHPEEVIEQWLLDDENSWSSLYVYFKYKFQEPRELPFVASMKVSLKSPQVLKIDVYEKEILGRVYIESLGQNAYFDKDGVVVEMSSEVIENVPKINGLDVKRIVLNEKLPIEGKSVLKNLLSLTQLLKKYQLEPESIKYGGEGNYTLKYGKLSVSMGQAQHFNEKVVRLSYLMPKLEGQKGTLHLESWTENTKDITFEKSG